MSTPLRYLGNVPSPLLADPPRLLDEAFFSTLVGLAALPIRTTEQDGVGALRPDGLSVPVLRRLALDWCAAMRECRVYGADELRGLELAIRDFTDEDFHGMLRGAAAVRRP